VRKTEIRLCDAPKSAKNGLTMMMNADDEAAIEEARRAGIDLSLIDTNIALPVEERWRQHDGGAGIRLGTRKSADRSRCKTSADCFNASLTPALNS